MFLSSGELFAVRRFEEKDGALFAAEGRGNLPYRRGIMQRDRGWHRKRDEKLSEPWRIASSRTRQQSSLCIHSMENNICPLGCFICLPRMRSQRLPSPFVSRRIIRRHRNTKRLSFSPFILLLLEKKNHRFSRDRGINSSLKLLIYV